MDEHFDVIVAGLGVMGAAAAFHIAKRGYRVLGLEQFTPLHNQGSSHGETRIIRQAYFEGPDYVPLIRRAMDGWTSLESLAGESLYIPTGGLMIGPPKGDLVRGSLLSARAHGLDHRLLEARETRALFHQFAVPEGFQVLLERNAGILRVEPCVRAFLNAAVGEGARLRFGHRIETWNRAQASGRIRITCAERCYEADALVMTAGAWTPALAGGYTPPLTINRMTVHWYQPGAEDETAYSTENMPFHIWQSEDDLYFYGTPTLPAPSLGPKVGFHSVRTACSPDRVERSVSAAEIEGIEGSVARYLPGLAGRHRSAGVCLYTNTPDDRFIIGPHPHQTAVFLACGFSGHGFKFAPVVGEILADLVVDGRTDHDIAGFDPPRFTN